MTQKINVLGIMSGTSLDGIDMVYVQFDSPKNYVIQKAETIPYPAEWIKQLNMADSMDARLLMILDRQYGHYLGELVHDFLHKYKLIAPKFVASHGHTIFHQPEKGLNFQIGHGASIAATSNIPVINDFRSADVAMGGQGAPLVPRGDLDLFPEYDAWLNLGGIANISRIVDGKITAWDICPCNQVLNLLSLRLDHHFDPEGKFARSGQLIPELLEKLDILAYYKQKPPKSLGKEWVDAVFMPIIAHEKTEDLLHTVCVHMATQIAQAAGDAKRILISGGGAYNTFLIEQIRKKSDSQWIIAEEQIIEFKEALIFAWLGYLRFFGKNNILSSVTGAKKDHSSGQMWGF